MTPTQDTVPAEALPSGRGADQAESALERFLAELRWMTPGERTMASRYSFNLWERSIYAARYPEEVPLRNGEVEWIAATLE